MNKISIVAYFPEYLSGNRFWFLRCGHCEKTFISSRKVKYCDAKCRYKESAKKHKENFIKKYGKDTWDMKRSTANHERYLKMLEENQEKIVTPGDDSSK